MAGEGAISASNPEQTRFYDGDGRLVKRLTGISDPASAAGYTIRASALGGRILTNLNGLGQKSETYVYAGGQIIATQTKSYVQGVPDTVVNWRRDPHNALAVSPGSVTILDPLGVAVSPVTVEQIQQYWQGQYQPPPGGWNPNGVGYGAPADSNIRCTLDGGPVTCSKAMRQVNNGLGELTPAAFPLGGVIGEGFALWGGFEANGEGGADFSGDGVILGTPGEQQQQTATAQSPMKQPCSQVAGLSDAATDSGILARLIFAEGTGSWVFSRQYRQIASPTMSEQNAYISERFAIASTVLNRVAYVKYVQQGYNDPLGLVSPNGFVGSKEFSGIADVIGSRGANNQQYAGFKYNDQAGRVEISRGIQNTVNQALNSDADSLLCTDLLFAIYTADLFLRGEGRDPFGMGKTFGMRTSGSGGPGANFPELGTFPGSGNTFYGVILRR